MKRLLRPSWFRSLFGLNSKSSMVNLKMQLQSLPPNYTNPQKLRQLQHQILTSDDHANMQQLQQYAKQLVKQRQYRGALLVSRFILSTRPLNLPTPLAQTLLQYSLSQLPYHLSTSLSSRRPRQPLKPTTLFLLLVLGFNTVLIGFFLYQLFGSNNLVRMMFEKLFNQTSPVIESNNITTKFTDVLGIDEFKEELEELVDYLKNSGKYVEAGAKLPKGVLLVGPPGTGKTLMARALAGEAGCSFLYRSGSEFDEMFVGLGARRVRELFTKARQKPPSIIFIDEVQSLAGKRYSGNYTSQSQSTNQLLTQMDGFKQSDNLIVIAATNMQDMIDPAFKRPGRFDKIIHVTLPDIKGREQIFDYYLRKIKHEEEIDKTVLARMTTGFSGADINNAVNLAILNAVKSGRQKANRGDFQYAYDRIVMGVGRTGMRVSEGDKKMTAYHELGHALTSILTPVTILPRGGALGFTAMVPQKDTLAHTKKTIKAHIDVCMGGRVAEQIFYGGDSVTTGCSDDLSRATKLAYNYIAGGMQQGFSLISHSDDIKLSESLKFETDQHVEQLLEESYQRVKGLLSGYENVIHQLARKLVDKETMDAEEIRGVVRGDG